MSQLADVRQIFEDTSFPDPHPSGDPEVAPYPVPLRAIMGRERLLTRNMQGGHGKWRQAPRRGPKSS